MIVVKNTKELEDNYNLNEINDNKKIRVLGGMEGKEKYNEQHYIDRTTYSAGQLKQIINRMRQIEDSIPKDYNQLQKAKYIYERLACNIEYNYDESTYEAEGANNLKIIMSQRGICAGYSLLYKEMMDRQGIECDYVRGIARVSVNKSEKHAWNILTIDGISFPIDLTWESDRIREGMPGFKYFGNDREFEKKHIIDSDEKHYDLSVLNKEQVYKIDEVNKKKVASTEEQKAILSQAVEETYKKFKDLSGEEIAQQQVSSAITNFIKETNAQWFTRNQGARENIEQNFKSEDMLNLIVKEYVENCVSVEEKDILNTSVKENLTRYNGLQAQEALKSYILSGDIR